MDGDEGRSFGGLFGGRADPALEHRMSALERRLADIEARRVATIDQTEFERMLMLALTSDRVNARIGEMFAGVLARSDLLTATSLRNWLTVFFAGMGLLFVLLNYLHP